MKIKKRLAVIMAGLVAGATLIAANPTKAEAASVPANANLLNTYGKVIPKVGTALVANEILNQNIMQMAKQEYNSMTVGNEMKPDYILGWSARLITLDQARAKGYYIPDNYPESRVPDLDFATVDKMMKACYDNGLALRGHTLVWHSQTPDWFFRYGYDKGQGYVNQNIMNKRMEYFIKTYMGHVCSSPYSSIVYAWDVVNEFLHAQNSGWQAIYGAPNTRAQFVKDAFNYAYDTLAYYKLTDKVKLFYNDYNTYMEVNDVINLINFINQGRKVCAGIGMQSHLSTDFPSAAYYKNALSSFRKAGFEIQITELDAGCKDLNTQAKYYYDIMRAILQEKKAGANITALVWWGMTDKTSWRNKENPLLYSDYNVKKPAYNSVLQAFFDEGYSMNGGNNNQPSQPSNPTVTGNIQNGWYYIKNVNANKYLTVRQNNGNAGENVELVQGLGIAGQKWYVNNLGNGYVTLKSALGEFMLDVANGSNANGTNIGIYHGYGGDAQQFGLVNKGNGRYVITTKVSNGNSCLDDYAKKTENGTNVCEWSLTGGTNQLWIFEKAN